MKQILFSIILSLLVIGCNSNGEVAPSDTAWAITKGESKNDVIEFMEREGISVTDEDSVLIGTKIGEIAWCGERWDVAIVKFNATKKANSVTLLSGVCHSDDKLNEMADFLATLYGEYKYDPELSTWTFRGDEHTKSFMAQYPRCMINVIWE